MGLVQLDNSEELEYPDLYHLSVFRVSYILCLFLGRWFFREISLSLYVFLEETCAYKWLGYCHPPRNNKRYDIVTFEAVLGVLLAP